MSVYTLELEGGKYYVGYSDDVLRRIAEHWLQRGSLWTRTHRPVKVLEVVPGNLELETAKTIALMCDKGWRNVRGGPYCQLEMRSMPIAIAKAMARRPPGELPQPRPSVYEYEGHVVAVQPPADSCTVEVAGELAAPPVAFVADDETTARSAAEGWLDLELSRHHGEERGPMTRALPCKSRAPP
jgi:hypothetical protein